MLSEHGQARDGKPGKEGYKGWSYRRTSEILKIPLGPLHVMCRLAEMLEKDKSLDTPDVSFKDAVERIRNNGKQ